MKKLKNSNTKLDNKIQDLINQISKGLERGRFESDDNTIEVKIANIVDYKLPNYKNSENGFIKIGEEGIAKDTLIKMNVRLSDYVSMGNYSDYVKGNIHSNYSSYKKVDTENLGNNQFAMATLIINRGARIFLAKSKATNKEKAISYIYLVTRTVVGSTPSLLGVNKSNSNGAYNLKDSSEIFESKGFKLIGNSKDRSSKGGYLPSIVDIKSNVQKEVYELFELIYEHLKEDFDKLFAISSEYVETLNLNDSEDEGKGNEEENIPNDEALFMVSTDKDMKIFELKTYKQIKSIEMKEPSATYYPLTQWAKMIDLGSVVNVSKSINLPKSKNEVKNISSDEAKKKLGQEVLKANARKNNTKLENGEQVLKTKKSKSTK